VHDQEPDPYQDPKHEQEHDHEHDHELEDDDLLPREITPGGSEVIRHELRITESDEDEPEVLSTEEMEAIEGHLEKFIGPVNNILHEIMSPDLHLDLVPIEPGEDRPWLTVCTMGMSALPMTLPEDAGVPDFAELLIALPGDWPFSDEAFEELGEDAWWPFRWLKELARLPISYDTFLGPGHTVPNGDPPEPLTENCHFAGFMVVPQLVAAEEADVLEDGEKQVSFYQLIPLFADELEYKLQEGSDALLELLNEFLSEAHVGQLADPTRPSVVGSR
jgi:hypothetical protein